MLDKVVVLPLLLPLLLLLFLQAPLCCVLLGVGDSAAATSTSAYLLLAVLPPLLLLVQAPRYLFAAAVLSCLPVKLPFYRAVTARLCENAAVYVVDFSSQLSQLLYVSAPLQGCKESTTTAAADGVGMISSCCCLLLLAVPLMLLCCYYCCWCCHLCYYCYLCCWCCHLGYYRYLCCCCCCFEVASAQQLYNITIHVVASGSSMPPVPQQPLANHMYVFTYMYVLHYRFMHHACYTQSGSLLVYRPHIFYLCSVSLVASPASLRSDLYEAPLRRDNLHQVVCYVYAFPALRRLLLSPLWCACTIRYNKRVSLGVV